MELVISNLTHGYVRAVNRVITLGQKVSARGIPTREISPMHLVIPELDTPWGTPMLPVGVGRKVNLKLAAVEALQLIGEGSYVDLLLKAAPQFTDVMTNKHDVEHGAYGPRITSQIGSAVLKLRDDPSTRQAVVSIWRSSDLIHKGDKPCTIFLQFMIRNNRLDLHAHMRSNDVWLGLTYDAWMFTQLQRTVARALGVRPGAYFHNAVSFHIYERNLEAAKQLHEPENDEWDLPPGIWPPEPGARSWIASRTTARALATGIADEGMHNANPWYSNQLARLRNVDED